MVKSKNILNYRRLPFSSLPRHGPDELAQTVLIPIIRQCPSPLELDEMKSYLAVLVKNSNSTSAPLIEQELTRYVYQNCKKVKKVLFSREKDWGSLVSKLPESFHFLNVETSHGTPYSFCRFRSTKDGYEFLFNLADSLQKKEKIEEFLTTRLKFKIIRLELSE